MRKVSIAAILGAAAAAAPTGAAAPAAPSLRIVDRTPLTISGRGFAARETVRLRVSARERITTRRVAASSGGAFSARFAFSLGRCDRVAVQAFGSSGSRARLFTTAPQPDCTSSG